MMPLHYMRLGGSEFLWDLAAWTFHLVRAFVTQRTSTSRPGQGGVAENMFQTPLRKVFKLVAAPLLREDSIAAPAPENDTCGIRTHAGRPHRLSRLTP